MLLYNKIRQLGRLFEKWAKEHNAAICPENVITWLHSNDLLNEEKALAFLEKNTKNEKELK